jgi:hypothetical protein
MALIDIRNLEEETRDHVLAAARAGKGRSVRNSIDQELSDWKKLQGSVASLAARFRKAHEPELLSHQERTELISELNDLGSLCLKESWTRIGPYRV